MHPGAESNPEAEARSPEPGAYGATPTGVTAAWSSSPVRMR
jgi:hypothetical protein